MKPAIVFDNVSKKFRRGERLNSLRDVVPTLVRNAFRKRRPDELGDREFWALRDVSFEVRPGEALAIIGSNGAGKSTALKLLTKIMRPTLGRCAVHGRVGALIEVAAGFHPDLTGRENVYLQGAIMGMKRGEIAQRFDDIVEFAGVSDFMDTPVKRYSSGMNARLGFSIAAHLSPTVLVIDEVLSVGDTHFQQKCVRRMQAFRDAGVAVVFVSHNMDAVAELCTSALLLSSGSTAMHGTPRDVIARFVAGTGDRQDTEPQSSRAQISAGRVDPHDGASDGAIVSGAAATFRATVTASRALRGIVFTFIVKQVETNLGVYAADQTLTGLSPLDLDEGDSVEVVVDFQCNLLRGHYYVEMHVYHPPTHDLYALASPAAFFNVNESATRFGIAALYPQSRIRRLHARTGDAIPAVDRHAPLTFSGL